MAKNPQPKRVDLSIQPPLAGISRKHGYQWQEPFSVIDSSNIWPVETRSGRRVTATRPPLVAITAPGSNGTDCNMACAINGDGAFLPTSTFVVARNGVLYRWNGSGYTQIDSGFSPPTVTTGRYVSSCAFGLQIVIANSGIPLVYNHASLGAGAGQRLTTLTASRGSVPVDCRCVAAWQGALWLAGSKVGGHILYASRTGDITDYNYAALDSDEGGAFSTSGQEEQRIGERVVALMPHTGDTMIVGCLNSMYALHSHPRRGGILSVVSPNLGPLGQGAWCVAPDGRMYVLTKMGLVTVDPEKSTLATISRDLIPDELINLNFDPENPQVSMAYNSRWHGIHITVRGAQAQAWFYDLTNGGLHRDVYASYPTLLLDFPDFDGASTSGVLFFGDGAAYGGVAQHNADGVESIAYNLYSGPIKIAANATYKTQILGARIVFGLPTDSTSGSATFWVGCDGEEVYQNAINNRVGQSFSSSLADLRNNNGQLQPMLSGSAMLLQLAGTGRMVFEGCDCNLIEAGQQRRQRNWSIAPTVNAGPDLNVEYK